MYHHSFAQALHRELVTELERDAARATLTRRRPRRRTRMLIANVVRRHTTPEPGCR